MKRSSSFVRGGLVAIALVAPLADTSSASEAHAASFFPSVRAVAAAAELAVAPAPPVSPPEPAPARREVDPFPGRTYGNLDGASCLDTLDERKIPYERASRTRGVETPVRLTGTLHGISVRADVLDAETTARRERYDCRLVLALDDLAALLAPRGVTEIVHYGIYRGDVPLPKKSRPLHHAAALAIDVAAFVKGDGARLEVRRDWKGRLGAPVCGAKAPPAPSDATQELRGILCDVVSTRTFHQILTPNHNRSHFDHFHLEVMRKTSWTIVE